MKNKKVLFASLLAMLMVSCGDGNPPSTESSSLESTQVSESVELPWEESSLEEVSEDVISSEESIFSEEVNSSEEIISSDDIVSSEEISSDDVLSSEELSSEEISSEEISSEEISSEESSSEEIPSHTHEYASKYEVINGDLYRVTYCSCDENDYQLVDLTSPVEVATAEELRVVSNINCNIKVVENIELNSILVFDAVNVELDLNGYSITGNWVSENDVCLIHATNGAHLSVTGNGKLVADPTSYVNTILCAVGSQIDIYSGEFLNEAGNALIYAQNNTEGTLNGTVNIYGGYFYVGNEYNGVNYMLNLDESDVTDESSINVYGGSFVNFDPANSYADSSAGTNLIGENCHSIASTEGENRIYTVSEHEFVATYDEENHYEVCICEATKNAEAHSYVDVEDNGYLIPTCSCGHTLEGKEIIDNIVSLYFSAPAEWWGDKTYCYLWNNTTMVNNSWPGQLMTYVETNEYGQKIYTIDVDLDQYDMIIFNNNNGWQSADTSLKGAKDNSGYYLNSDNTLGTYTYQPKAN